MALFNLFRSIKPRKFDYIPKYYNPEKEDLERRMRKHRTSDEKGSIEDTKLNIQAGLRSRTHKIKTNSSSSIMVLVIAVLLLLLAIFVISSYLPSIIEFLEG